MPTDIDSIQKYMDRIHVLPESIRKTLTQFETAEYLGDTLAPQFSLAGEQIEELTRITRDILLGDIFIKDMAVNISQKLNLDEATAQQIRGKIINELFAPAIESIKKIQQEKFPDRVRQGTAPAQPIMPKPPAPSPVNSSGGVNDTNVIDLRNQS